jgi:hypothetical protein
MIRVRPAPRRWPSWTSSARSIASCSALSSTVRRFEPFAALHLGLLAKTAAEDFALARQGCTRRLAASGVSPPDRGKLVGERPAGQAPGPGAFGPRSFCSGVAEWGVTAMRLVYALPGFGGDLKGKRTTGRRKNRAFPSGPTLSPVGL